MVQDVRSGDILALADGSLTEARQPGEDGRLPGGERTAEPGSIGKSAGHVRQ